MDESDSKVRADSAAVQAHLGMMQAVIQRMADNSRSCKLWCVTLVAAMLVLMADTGNANYAWLALVPTAALGFLDVYYLSMEQRFRNSHDNFVGKLHNDELDPAEVYVIKPCGSVLRHLWKSTRSASVWPFYPALVGVVALATQIA